MIINDLFKVPCSSLYISSSEVTNIEQIHSQPTRNHNRLGRTKFKQSEQTGCPFVFQPLIRVWVTEVSLLPPGEAHGATDTIQHLWGNPRVA